MGHRLRKVEARRRSGGGLESMYLVFGRSAAEVQELVGLYDARPTDVGAALWPFDEPAPEPRWTNVADMTDRELEAIISSVRALRGDEAEQAAPTPDWVTKSFSDAQLHDLIIVDMKRDRWWMS